MKQRLQVSLGQQLSLTPQLQQAIRLLQLPVADLAAELAEAVASNPLLEWADEPSTVAAPQPVDQGDHAKDDFSSTHLTDSTWPENHHSGEDDTADIAEYRRAEDTLHDHLRWQLHLRPLSNTDRAIAAALIDALDEDGYLREPLEVIVSTLSPDIPVEVDEVMTILRLIQDMDPAGLGARDLSECLCLQLQRLPEDTRWKALAMAIAKDHLSQLPRAGISGLAHQLRRTPEDIAGAVALLRSLNPRPASHFTPVAEANHVLPDIIFWRTEGRWRARLGAHAAPPVIINQHYANLISQSDTSDASYLREQLQQARWFIKGLQARGQTLLRVADRLIVHQSGFLEFGDCALRPLTLREMAAELELHESTISRAIAGKYAHTPRGTFPMRHFFSQSVTSDDGGEASSTAIQAMIRRLIQAENPRKPLSDAKLVAQLQADGITVARRTVAKYREAMSIPPSHERVRMS